MIRPQRPFRRSINPTTSTHDIEINPRDQSDEMADDDIEDDNDEEAEDDLEDDDVDVDDLADDDDDVVVVR